MKSSVLVLFLSFLGFGSLQAQENVDTNYYDPPRKLDRFIFQYGYAGWLEKPDGIELEPWSYNITVHYMQDIPFGESAFAGAIGLGFASHNTFYNGLFVEDPDGEEPTQLQPYPDGEEPDKNKLSANYLNVPVELRFRSSGSPAFKISVGGEIGYMVNLHNKIIDGEGKRKFYGIDGVNPLRYGAKARIGYGRLNAYGYYALTPFFEEGKGPELVPFALGLSLTLF